MAAEDFIGKSFKNNKGLEFTVQEYLKYSKILVKFKDSGHVRYTSGGHIKSGAVADNSIPTKRTGKPRKPRGTSLTEGDILINKSGQEYQIIEVISKDLCKVKFLDWFGQERVVRHQDAREGVRNFYQKATAGVGYIGEGKYGPRENPDVYNIWSNMLKRCYVHSVQIKHPSYKGCSVAEEWHNFQNFAEWCYSQVEYLENPDWHLDKDILVKGNKVYSPWTCSFVPRLINNTFSNRKNRRGDYPLGVTKDKRSNSFRASVQVGGRTKDLGFFKSPELAHRAYKEVKESVVRELAEKFKGKIKEDVYLALMAWEVEETD